MPSASGTCARGFVRSNGPSLSDCPPAWPGSPLGLTRLLSAGDEKISQVPGGTLHARPALRPRPGVSVRRFDGYAVACRQQEGVGPNHKPISGLNHAARVLAVYASPRTIARCGARLATSRSATPWLGGTFTRWLPMIGFDDASYITYPFPKLCLAHLVLGLGGAGAYPLAKA